MNYYPFHLGDYAAHTAHLDLMEDLAYRRMLDLYYRTERPLPEPAEIARLIRMRDHAGTIRDVLNEFFEPSPDGYRHARCGEEIERMQDKQAKARASAAASVAARSTNAQRTLNGRSTKVELPTPTPTPTPEEKTKTARKRAAAAPLVSVDELVSEGVGRQHAIDWLATRKAKTLPLTRTAWDDTKAEALKAGITAPEAVAMSAANAWGGFRASWVAADAKNTRHASAAPSATVPSDEAARTAAYLAEQSARVHDPPPNLGELLKKAKQSVGSGSLRAVA